MTTTFKYLGYLAIVMAICTISYGFYLAVFQLTVIDAIRQPFPVLTKTVHVGETVRYVPAICKYTDSEGIITRQLTGTEYRFLITEPSNLPMGCNGGSVRTVELPANIEPGKYKILITVTYELNVLHRETFHWEAEEFTVLPADESATQGPQGIQGPPGPKGDPGTPAPTPSPTSTMNPTPVPQVPPQSCAVQLINVCLRI